MRIRQYASLIIWSEALSPERLSEIVGMDADESHARGSRNPGPPPKPRSNLWYLRSGVPDDRPLSDHLDPIFERIENHADGLQGASASPQTFVTLILVRRFEPGDEDFDEATYGIPPGSDWVRLSGQHPFLGWGIDSSRIALLARLGIGLDVDEYE